MTSSTGSLSQQSRQHETTVYEVIDWCRETSESEQDKGTKFERASKYYLKNDPLWAAKFDDVWMWKDAPTNNGHDIGIDLVAKDAEDGSYWAIQCKCYDEDTTLDYKTVSTFFGATGNAGAYGHNMLISTTEHFSSNLDKVTTDWGTVRLFPFEMDEARIDWQPFLEGREPDKHNLLVPLPHQREAIDACKRGFVEHDRGKLIMACGTGKTLTSLRLAEEMLPKGALVLFLAPSISLVAQTMRVWANQAAELLKCAVVCSDAKASDAGVDIWESSLKDLPYPATTDPRLLFTQMRDTGNGDGLNVIFATYQSIQVVSDAQKLGLDPFDLIVCDEAHRTTGLADVAGSKQDQSEFVKVHDNTIVSAKKRLYMTATPRIYGDVAKKKAKAEDYEVSSMDDESKFGPEFYRLSFGNAVDAGLLTDYKVIALTVSEDVVSSIYQKAMAEDDGFEIPDAAKIIGCWKGLADQGRGEDGHPLKNAVAFCSTIAESKRIQDYFKRVVDAYISEEEKKDNEMPRLHCEIEHVDGNMDSTERKQKIKWLAQTRDDKTPTCRILSNARCLSEGIDVPNLDAVMFLQPKRSQIDITQAVGRVMRKFAGKEYGYIILPIVIPAGMTAEQALDENEPFQVVWEILKALRSHDERLEARINALPYDLTSKNSPVTVASGTPESNPANKTEGEEGVQEKLYFSQHDLQEAVNAMIVRKCGTSIYWDEWAKDIAQIAKRHIARISELTGEGGPAREPFMQFLTGLRNSLNNGITEPAAVDMLAQHMITLPVFEALFSGADFASSNPVSIAMEKMIDSLRGYDLVTGEEERELGELYRSVEIRAEAVKTDAGRQRIIKELYEKFFSQAFKATSDKMGIVYTPNQVVDYILHATNRIMQKEFGQSLSDQGVHILDPFTGTGTFIVNLINDKSLMPADKLTYKYKNELHCNEIVLLAYYIATINIEHSYHSRVGGEYVPFPGAVLTDTFQMSEVGDPLDLEVFVDNSERILSQMETPINVIVGNPPYSVGQKSENDNNKNETYPTLDNEISETYAAQGTAGLKKGLYDPYIRAFRWATDRIGNRGIISFVSNGGWLDNASMDGFRRCLLDDFNSIYIFNLRGDQNTQGEQSRREGGKIFGSGSRVPVAIAMLIKNPASTEHGVIHYHDIGDYISREDKLSIIASAIMGESFEWKTLHSDRHGDWINQREESFYDFIPIALSKRYGISGLFQIYSLGVSTNRDAWVYSFSRQELAEHVKATIDVFNEEVDRFSYNPDDDIDRFVISDPTKIKWSANLKQKIAKDNPKLVYDSSSARLSSYRPFCKQWLYFDKDLNSRPGHQAQLFPDIDSDNRIEFSSDGLGANRVICISEGDSFSVLLTDCIPNLHYVGDSQCFPLYWYDEHEKNDGLFRIGKEIARNDAIADEALNLFRRTYPSAYTGRLKRDGGHEIEKEDIFYYVYGILHSAEYRNRFSANLKKELPRIPLAGDFKAFSLAGRGLAKLHLEYESVEPYPLGVRGTTLLPGKVKKMHWGKKRDPETGKKVDDHTVLFYNEHLTYTDIPEVANDYKVNGRSPLEWMIDRYQVKTDKASGIVNDPNEYSDNPNYISDLIPRLVRVSMETLDIMNSLPPLNEKAQPADWPMAWKASE